MLLKCALAKGGTRRGIALSSHMDVECGPGDFGPLLLFLMSAFCFEALSGHKEGRSFFSGSSCTSDNPFWHRHTQPSKIHYYTHLNSMHKIMWHRRWNSYPHMFWSAYRHIRDAETYSISADYLHSFKLFLRWCQLVVGSDVAVSATQLAVVTST